jgi:hypothetical protein
LDEKPFFILSLERCRLMDGLQDRQDLSEEIRNLQQEVVQDNVLKTVESWIGQPEATRRKKKQKDAQGRYCFYLEDAESVYQLSSNKVNVQRMWKEACADFKPWYQHRSLLTALEEPS